MEKSNTLLAAQEPAMSVFGDFTRRAEVEHDLVRRLPMRFLELKRAARPVSSQSPSLHEVEEGSSPFRHNVIVRRTHGILGKGRIAQDALPVCPFWAKIAERVSLAAVPFSRGHRDQRFLMDACEQTAVAGNSLPVSGFGISGLSVLTSRKVHDWRGFLSETFGARAVAPRVGEVAFVECLRRSSIPAEAIKRLFFQFSPVAVRPPMGIWWVVTVNSFLLLPEDRIRPGGRKLKGRFESSQPILTETGFDVERPIA